MQYLWAEKRPQKILFDHLPKCGGSTLNSYLQEHYPYRKTYTINGQEPQASVDRFKQMPQNVRYGYDLINGHMANQLLDSVHPDCLKVTLLRDPVERIISHYFYARSIPFHYLHDRIHAEGITLHDYVSMEDLSTELQNWYIKHFSGLTADAVKHDPETAVSLAYDTLMNRYDLVGFLDQYSAFIKSLQKLANLRHPYRTKRINVTQNKPTKDSIPAETLQRIRQFNDLDIKLYARLHTALAEHH